jgi:hypothetical protein
MRHGQLYAMQYSEVNVSLAPDVYICGVPVPVQCERAFVFHLD